MTNLKYLAWLILIALVFAVGRDGSAQTASASGREKAESKSEGSTAASGPVKSGPEASAQAAQTTSAASEQDVDVQRGIAQLRSGAKISTELVTTLDASKAKPGDEVVAKVTKDVKQDGRAVIKKGDRLLGHVASASAAASGKAGAEMSIVFDRLSRGGAVVDLSTMVSSIVSTSGDLRGGNEPMMPSEPMMAQPQGVARGGSTSSSGGLVGGLTSTAGATVNAAGSAVGGVGSTLGGTANSTLGAAGSAVGATSSAAGQANAAAGLSTPSREIRVGSDAGAGQRTDMTSLISSRQGNLRLESGTQMRFRVAAQSDTKAQKH